MLGRKGFVRVAVALAILEGTRGAGAPVSIRAGTTYYVSPSGSDSNAGTLSAPWASIQAAADRVGPGDTVLIRGGTYHERVVVRNSGVSGAEITFAAYPGEVPVVDGTGISMPDWLSGLFEVSAVSHIRVRGLRVQHSGPHSENAGFLVENSRNVVLEGNTTDDTASSGIGVWGSQDVTVDGNEVINACNGGQQEEISIGGTAGFDVVRNLVHDGGKTANGGEGITLKDGSHGGRVRGNRVWNIARGVGIYVDAWDKHTYDIEVSGNVVHDVRAGNGINLASEMGGLLEDIRVFNNVVYGNGVYGVQVGAYGGVPNHPMRNLSVMNNTIAGNGAGWGGGIAVDNPEATGVVVRNNVVSGNLTFQIVVANGVPAASVSVDHNLVDGFRGDEGETRGTEYVEGNPLFVNAAAHDYHLAAGSLAIDRGSSAGAPPADFDGISRPQGVGFDIGAYERISESGCWASSTSLCLNGSRFRVEASYRDYGGHSGPAQAAALTTDTGYFWFFSRENVEVVIKVLDFCGVSGSWAVYAAGLTDVEITLTVTDTRTGSSKSYRNALGSTFELIRDAPFACP